MTAVGSEESATSPPQPLGHRRQSAIKNRLGLGVEDLSPSMFIGRAALIPAYRKTMSGAFRMGWPRIPLPGWPDG